MIRGFTIIFLLLSLPMFSQDHDENISALIDRYTSKLDVDCEIKIETDVEGMIVPDKIVRVKFKDNGKPKVEGKGIMLLPKKGMLNQFHDMLTSPFQAIYLSKRKDNLVYKLVSLDPNSDWITADLEFNENTFLVQKSIVNTHNHGTFYIEHNYKTYDFPSQSVITFNVKKFKLPLKFIGRTETTSSSNSNNENVIGKVTLSYTYLD